MRDLRDLRDFLFLRLFEVLRDPLREALRDPLREALRETLRFLRSLRETLRFLRIVILGILY